MADFGIFFPHVARTLEQSNMGNETSKRGRESATQPEDAARRCPLCGTSNAEQLASSVLNDLFLSHAELCTALRLVGRQMLQFGKRDDQSLDKMRQVLKRAENIRKTLNISNEPLKNADELLHDQTTPVSGSPSATPKEGPARKGARRTSRLTRSRSFGLLRFPPG